MKNELREHVKTKRKIRQAKRISAVDQTRGKRIFRAWLFLAIVVVFVIAECVGLFLAKRESDRQKSVDIQNQMVADLAIISTAFQSGNQPLFDKNFANYQTHLNTYSRTASSNCKITPLRLRIIWKRLSSSISFMPCSTSSG